MISMKQLIHKGLFTYKKSNEDKNNCYINKNNNDRMFLICYIFILFFFRSLSKLNENFRKSSNFFSEIRKKLNENFRKSA